MTDDGKVVMDTEPSDTPGMKWTAQNPQAWQDNRWWDENPGKSVWTKP